MTNPPILVITGLGGYFKLNFLQKSGCYTKYGRTIRKNNYQRACHTVTEPMNYEKL